MALVGFTAANAAEQEVVSHSGTFYNHFTDANTPCTVNEYADGTWEVVDAYGYEGMTFKWTVNEDGTIKFDYSDPTLAYAGYYYTDNSDYVWLYNNGYSAYEVTSYNGSDIWWFSYNSSWENGGYDAIYWDQPEVLGVYEGTYCNGYEDTPYAVTVEELSNGMVRVNDFYGYAGYPLYVDISEGTPVVANAEADDEESAPYVSAGWEYTNPKTGAWTSIDVYPAESGASFTSSVVRGKTIMLPVVVKAELADDVEHVDVISWGAPALVASHEGIFWSHLTQTNTACVVNEYENDIWEVPSAFGVEGFDIAWQILDDEVIFVDYDDTWSSYACYWGYIDAWFNYYAWNSFGGYSAYEVTTFNGSDIWFWCYDYRNGTSDLGGYDAIYWDLPSVETTYKGTYSNGFNEEPYAVDIEMLDNGMVRVNDFYGNSGYNLYLDLSGDVPAVANFDDDDETNYYVQTGGWYYYSSSSTDWGNEIVEFEKIGCSYVVNTLDDNVAEHVVTLPAYVYRGESEQAVKHDDQIKWFAMPSGVATVAAENDAESVYYNLQGIRVANPSNGLYIKVQGRTASKVLVK